MSEIFLSICIATFNRGEYIGETINSIFSQNISEEIEMHEVKECAILPKLYIGK
jgi:glycosyltransferase involved in cell wall biosynthesis